MSESDGHIRYPEFLRYKRLELGVIRLDQPFGFGWSSIILDEIHQIRQRGITTIHFTLNSPGGEVYESFAVYDIIKALPEQGIHTVITAIGIVASAAAMVVLQAAEIRQSLPNSYFMLHEITRHMTGPESTSQTSEQLTYLNRLQRQVLELLATRIGKTPAEITRSIRKKDLWLTAPEAVAYNLIDRITTEVF